MQRDGVSLVEIMIAIVVSSIVLGGAYMLHAGIYRSLLKSSNYSDSEQGCYRKLDMASSLLRRSKAVVSVSNTEITLLTHEKDTQTIEIHGDSLFRVSSGEYPKFWFSLGHFQLSLPAADSGWVMGTLSAEYPGRNETVHTISRRVALYKTKKTDSESDWGF